MVLPACAHHLVQPMPPTPPSNAPEKYHCNEESLRCPSRSNEWNYSYVCEGIEQMKNICHYRCKAAQNFN